MHIPDYVKTMLSTLVKQLYEILPESARPSQAGLLIDETFVSKTDDIAAAQRYYNLICAIQAILPEIEKCKSVITLNAYLVSQFTPSVFSANSIVYTHWSGLEARFNAKSVVVGLYSYYAATAVYLGLHNLLFYMTEGSDSDELFVSGSSFYNAFSFLNNQISANLTAKDPRSFFNDSEINPFSVEDQTDLLAGEITELGKKLEEPIITSEVIALIQKEYNTLKSKFETLCKSAKAIPIQKLVIKENDRISIQNTVVSEVNEFNKKFEDIEHKILSVKLRIELQENRSFLDNQRIKKIEAIEKRVSSFCHSDRSEEFPNAIYHFFKEAQKEWKELSTVTFDITIQQLPYTQNQYNSDLLSDCKNQWLQAVTQQKERLSAFIDKQSGFLKIELTQKLANHISAEEKRIGEKIEELRLAFENRKDSQSNYSTVAQNCQNYLNDLKFDELLNTCLTELEIDSNDADMKIFIEGWISSNEYKETKEKIATAVKPLETLIKEKTAQINLEDADAVKKFDEKIRLLEKEIHDNHQLNSSDETKINGEMASHAEKLISLGIEPIEIDLNDILFNPDEEIQQQLTVISNKKAALQAKQREQETKKFDAFLQLKNSINKANSIEKMGQARVLKYESYKHTTLTKEDHELITKFINQCKNKNIEKTDDFSTVKQKILDILNKIQETPGSKLARAELELQLKETVGKIEICDQLDVFFKSLKERDEIQKKQIKERKEKIVSLEREKIVTMHQRDLAKLRFDLMELQKKIQDQQYNLKSIEIIVSSFKLSDAQAFNFTWEKHEKVQSQKIEGWRFKLATFHARYLKTQQQLNTIQKTYETIQGELRKLENTQEIAALQPVMVSIANQLEQCSQDNQNTLNDYQAKTAQLTTVKKQLAGDADQVNVYRQLRKQIDDIVCDINQKNSDLGKHQYNQTTIEQLANGGLNNPAYILGEDQFYVDCQNQIDAIKKALAKLEQTTCQAGTSEDVVEAFNAAKQQKIAEARAQLQALEPLYNTQKNQWLAFGQANLLIENSRIVGNAMDVSHYVNYDLRGIHLTDKNYSNESFNGANFSRATLTRVNFTQCDLARVNFSHAQLTNINFSGCQLGRVDFTNATFTECNFADANFRGIIINAQTNLNWNLWGHILLQNVTDTEQNAQDEYLVNLVNCVVAKCDVTHKLPAGWLLGLLRAINDVTKPDDKDAKAHLVWQKQMALMVMGKLVPKLELEQVLALVSLVDTKHDEDQNPYAFIRREQDTLRATYGNTRTWEIILEGIKDRLGELTENEKLEGNDLDNARKIMNTHTTHDYFFGWAYAPQKAKDWEARHASIEVSEPQNKRNQ